MKRKATIIFLAAVALVTMLAGCRNASHNGKLDGNWRVQSIELLPSGPVETPPEGVQMFFAFSNDLMQMKCYPGIYFGNTGIMSYEKGDNHLTVRFPYVDAVPDSIAKYLSPFGIYSNPEEFEIVRLTGKELVLESDRSVVSLERF